MGAISGLYQPIGTGHGVFAWEESGGDTSPFPEHVDMGLVVKRLNILFGG